MSRDYRSRPDLDETSLTHEVEHGYSSSSSNDGQVPYQIPPGIQRLLARSGGRMHFPELSRDQFSILAADGNEPWLQNYIDMGLLEPNCVYRDTRLLRRVLTELRALPQALCRVGGHSGRNSFGVAAIGDEGRRSTREQTIPNNIPASTIPNDSYPYPSHAASENPPSSSSTGQERDFGSLSYTSGITNIPRQVDILLGPLRRPHGLPGGGGGVEGLALGVRDGEWEWKWEREWKRWCSEREEGSRRWYSKTRNHCGRARMSGRFSERTKQRWCSARGS
ncbi:uncharacterized protein BDZ99DRAFT_549913 [Mytilinidion resinicola]|uniref:Uncharacterized protein n=1 Tax=Mytilinidion resinicola TaxID=574789 RepID=A0A6A6Z4S5_9PEZI|nr:uncharacterized protein BDZ99DRAFT_549913 [Mytilinidion resinicola]KAF2815294.1 hypothetical protein BDZ99DRAFT_549913 [Mytilinidion resinicola]